MTDKTILETPLSDAEARLLCEERWTYIQELLVEKAALERSLAELQEYIDLNEVATLEQREEAWRRMALYHIREMPVEDGNSEALEIWPEHSELIREALAEEAVV